MSNQPGPVKGFRPLGGTSPSSAAPASTSSQPTPVTRVNHSQSVPTYSSPPAPGAQSNTPMLPSGPTCPSCYKPIVAGAKFCMYCGASVSTPPPTRQAVTVGTFHTITHNPVALSANQSPWSIFKAISVFIVCFSFFLPFNVVDFKFDQFSLFGADTEKLNMTILLSPWQILTASAPTIDNQLGIDNETAFAFGQQMLGEVYDVNAWTWDRIAIVLLGLMILVAIATAVLSFASKTNPFRWAGLLIGVFGIIIVIGLSSLYASVFQTGIDQLDSMAFDVGLVDSMIRQSSGIGFWGMVIGFAAFTVGSYKNT